LFFFSLLSVICSRFCYLCIYYSAEFWPLTKPLQCCSFVIERRGNAILLIFTYSADNQLGPHKLFALCTVDVVGKSDPLEHYVEPVMDSTRYFVVRVTDEKAGREALIGLGFREQNEAADFRATLARYQSDIAKEKTARAIKMVS
jgi:hypothetical protein